MTSGCVADSASAAAGSSWVPRTTTWTSSNIRIGVDRHVRRQGQITHVNALIDLKIADIDLDRVGNRAGLALDAQAVNEMLENATGGDTGRLAAQLDRDLGLDDLLGADATEIEVENLLAEVIPLHVADQNGLGRAADVEVGEMPGCLDHPPDVVPTQADGHDSLLVTVDHGGNPPRLPATGGRHGCRFPCSSPGRAVRPEFSQIPSLSYSL